MKNKSYLKMSLFIIIIVGLFAALIYLLFKDNDDESSVTVPNIVNISYDEYSSLYDSDIAFTLQKLINNFYESLRMEDTDEVLDMLNNNYIIDNSVNNSNLYDKFDNDYSDIQVIVKGVLYYKESNISYYIVNAYMYREKYNGDREFNNDLYYLVILDNSSFKYNIYPVNEDIYTFMNRYDYNEVNELKSSYTKENLSTKNKLRLYITDFLVLLDYDANSAYDMLGNKTKTYFGSFDGFNSQIEFIKDNVSASVFSYYEEEVDNVVTYKIVDDNQNNITITENSAMNYKMDIEFILN